MNIDRLADELLLNIIEFLCPDEEFATVYDYDGPPPLKSLSECSRRLYGLCFPYLFRSVRLRLRKDEAREEIRRLRQFLVRVSLPRPFEKIAIGLGDSWNDGKVGLELKKFLWEHRVSSLSLHQSRGDLSVREKCARWPYSLGNIQKLRLHTIDRDIDLRMLLLRQCPVEYVEVNDGNYKDGQESDLEVIVSSFRRHYRAYEAPAIGYMKPALFPKLTRLCYRASWPPVNRCMTLFTFVATLPALRHFTVALMDGEDVNLKHSDIWFRPTADGILYRRTILAYQRLAAVVDEMNNLEFLVISDRKIPFDGDTEAPHSFLAIGPGIYRKKDAIVVDP